MWRDSNVLVSIDGTSDEFALLRIDRYQLDLLISRECVCVMHVVSKKGGDLQITLRLGRLLV